VQRTLFEPSTNSTVPVAPVVTTVDRVIWVPKVGEELDGVKLVLLEARDGVEVVKPTPVSDE
jgi:hypothetical protein